jgi:RHS repeat-associated protein
VSRIHAAIPVVIVACLLLANPLYASDFERGDCNADGQVNIADAIYLLAHLFSGGEDPLCFDAADTNDDGTINIADAIYLLAFLFSGGSPPPEPFDICGPDPTDDTLTCDSFPPCPDTPCPDGDADADGVCDSEDICEGGDDAVDTDSDGVPDFCDVCEGGDDAVDTDSDGVPDFCDVCEGGDDAVDTDSDGVPDFCDICEGGDDAVDTDGDGVPDFCDPCPDDNPDDANGNGVCDSQEPSFVPEPPRNGRVGVDANDNPTGGVLLHSGELTMTRIDMAIAGRRLGFAFVRTYRSGDPNTPASSGPLGKGWDANVFRRLELLAGGNVRRHLGNGRFDDYTDDGSGGFNSPVGIYSRLKQTAGGGFQERSPSGTIHSYNLDGRLEQIEDRIGNTLTYSYNGTGLLDTVTDDFGRVIAFTYNGGNLLTIITDFTGREVVFSYDGDDHLSEARSPVVLGTVTSNDFPDGIREQYGYNEATLPDHLTDVIFANEVEDGSLIPAIINNYGTDAGIPATFGRIISQQVGGTNASGITVGGTLLFGYNPAPIGVPSGTVILTIVTDRNGNIARYSYNATGHLLRKEELDPVVLDPFKTTFQFNIDGEVTSFKQPMANEIQFSYEAKPPRFSQGNLLEIRRIADTLRGDGFGSSINDIVTTFTYEPLFNLPLTSTEPRGNDDEYVPQNDGLWSPERYRATFTYDWQEGAAAPAVAAEWDIVIAVDLLNLGDRNDDGATDQQMGLLIRTDEPTVNLLVGSNQALAEGDTEQERITRIENNDFGQPTRITDPIASVVELSYFPENDPDGDGSNIIPGQDPVTGGYNSGSVADPAGLAISSSVTRNPRGKVLTSTDPKGNEYIFTYNNLDWPIRSEDPRVDPSQDHGYYREIIFDANGAAIEEAIENWTMDVVTREPVLVPEPLRWFRHTNVRDILSNVREQIVDARRDSAIVLPPTVMEAEFLETQITRDNNENVTEVKSPMAVLAASGDSDEFNVVGNEYDARDLLRSQTRGLGSANPSTWTFRRDRNGNRTSTADAVDNDGDALTDKSFTTFDGFDRAVKFIDRADNEMRLTLDPASLVIRKAQRGPADGSGGPNVPLAGSNRLFDEAGGLFQLDADLFIPGLPPGVPLPGVILEDGPLTPGDGKITTRFDRDAAGFSTFRLEDDGHFYQTIRDAVHRVTTRTLPLIDGNDPNERTRTETCFDDNGNPLKVTQIHTSPEGIAPIGTMIHRIQVDTLNRVIRSSDPEGNTTYIDRDSRGNVVVQYDAAAGTVDMVTYEDPCLVAPVNLITNVRGNPVFHFFDGASRPWLTQREMHFGGLGDLGLDTFNPDIPDGLVDTVTVWDANSRVSHRIDDMGNETIFSHDRFNRQTGRTHADGGLCSWSFDLDHQLTGITDENGSEHAFEVDAIGRMLSHTITPVSTTIAGTALPMLIGSTEQTWQYNGRSQITLCTDNNDPADLGDDSIVASIPDSLGRLLNETQILNAANPFQGPVGAFPNTVARGYVSDDLVQITYPNGREISFAHDDHDQFKSVSDERLCYTECLMGNCNCDAAQTTWKMADPVTGDYFVIMTEVQTLDGNQLPVSTTLTSTLGEIEGGFSIDNRRGDLNVIDFVQSYGFDSSGDAIERAINLMLDSLDRQQGAFVVQQQSFTETEMQIDGAQAIKFIGTIEDSPGAPPVFTDRVLPRNEVHQIDLPEYQNDPSPGNGNRTADANHYYQWDGFNRLRSVIDRATFAVIASYRYDAHPAIFGGRRIEKTITNSPVAGLDGITRFYYNGAHVIEERKVENDVEQVTRQFIHGNQADEWVAMDVDTDDDGIPDHLYFYVRDFNENVTHLIDAETETVEEIYFYDPLAAPRIIDPATLAERETSSVGNPYMMTGRRWEPETGLYYYRARYLHPVDGEFLSRDPLGMWGDGANLGNGLAYVGNNPWNGRDPSGLGEFLEEYNGHVYVITTFFGIRTGDKYIGKFATHNGKKYVGIESPTHNRIVAVPWGKCEDNLGGSSWGEVADKYWDGRNTVMRQSVNGLFNQKSGVNEGECQTYKENHSDTMRQGVKAVRALGGIVITEPILNAVGGVIAERVVNLSGRAIRWVLSSRRGNRSLIRAAKTWSIHGTTKVSEAFSGIRVRDSDWVHFGPSDAAESMFENGVTGHGGSSYWLKYGEVKDMTMGELKWKFGPMSQSAESNLGTMVIHRSCDAITSYPSKYGFAQEGIARNKRIFGTVIRR